MARQRKSNASFERTALHSIKDGSILPDFRSRHRRREIGLLQERHTDGTDTETHTFVALLKTCGQKRDISKGINLHAQILNRGLLENNPYIASTLISMYAKCGMIEKAQDVLENVPVRDLVCWNALIAGYAQQGQGQEALNCFERMQSEGLSPDVISFICILKACANIGAIEKGKQIHEEIVSRGLLKKDVVLGTALVDMYAKCMMLPKAKQVLEELLVRNVVSWNALITGYTQKGQGHEALNCFDQMQREGISPNTITFICILKACGSIGAIEKGNQVHEEIAGRNLLEKDIVLGTALVDMYAKCGVLVKAKQVLEELSVRNIVSWNALIVGYLQQGQFHEVLHCFERMLNEGLSPNSVTFISILKACGSTGAISKGEKVHEEILNRGLKKDIMLGTALVDMYAKCGVLAKAQAVLDELPVRNIVSWSALIAGYAQQGQGQEAINCFERMQGEGLFPDTVTFTCILKACSSTGAVDKGKQIHEEVANRGLLEKNSVLGTALVDMYAKCGCLAKAQEVLEDLSIHNVVSWNALITGYVQQGEGHEALICFEKMLSEGLSPDAVTFTSILKACGEIGAIDKGKKIHDEIINRGLLEKDIVFGNALVDMYSKCGVLAKAQEVLQGLPVRNVVSWSALIAGYVQRGQSHEALNCFERMQSEGFSPDAVTLICILRACASTGAIDIGEEIHEQIVNRSLLDKDVVLGTALVDMYAKCCQLGKAQKVLKALPTRDVVAWNTLIAGYAQQGQGHEALNCFELMQSEGFSPDAITFLCVLSACGRSGLLDEAQTIFGDMSRKYDVTPNVKHHTCMVVVFGYAGLFDKAMSVIKVMPSSDYHDIWVALLGGCRKWGNVELGILAFDQAVQLDGSCAVAYVLIANIFAAAGMQEDADKVEAMRLKYAVWKDRGNSVWVDAGGNAHSFSVGDTRHPQRKVIHAKIKAIALKMKQAGYPSSALWVLRSSYDDGKNDVLCGHSEKLAIACALINTYQGETIHVVNNMCVCSHCHFGTSLISKMENRKIMIRDPKNLHVFEDGKCVCNGPTILSSMLMEDVSSPLTSLPSSSPGYAIIGKEGIRVLQEA